MKKLTLLITICLATFCFGRHHHGGYRGFHGGRYHHHVRHFHHGHHYHGSWWGRGGRNFWPGFVGGVVGGVVLNNMYTPRTTVVTTPIVTTPTVVTTTQPVIQTAPVVVNQPVYQQIWVEGKYIDQVQPNGTTIRVWQPGHYETVRVQ